LITLQTVIRYCGKYWGRFGAALALMGVLGLLAACQPIRPDASGQRSPNGVIFTAEQSQADLSWIDPQAEGTWTPTSADVAKLEADLIPFLQQAQHHWLRPDPPIWERAPDYKRQYLGLVKDGEQVIYANFFCQVDDGMDWKKEFVFVNDGGDCYFQVIYHVATGEFSDFSVNGEA
jgi:hypothetical protein